MQGRKKQSPVSIYIADVVNLTFACNINFLVHTTKSAPVFLFKRLIITTKIQAHDFNSHDFYYVKNILHKTKICQNLY